MSGGIGIPAKARLIALVIVCGIIVPATVGAGSSQSVTLDDSITVEIVETVPTDLDSPTIRNTFDVWIELFQNAENTIDIEAPYINQGGITGLFDNLLAAANRGVQIRILTNTWSGPSSLSDHENVNVLDPDDDNLAIHGKYLMVDGGKAFVGSQNWSSGGVLNNREMGVLIDSEQLAGAYSYIFESGWVAAGGENKGENYWESESIYPVASGPEIPSELKNTATSYENLINSAQTSVKVYVYVFSTGAGASSLANALTSAAERGVKVQLMLDKNYYARIWAGKEGNIDFSDRLDNLKDVGGILIKLIYLGSGSYSHPKMVIVDGERAYVGSANWTSSSLDGRREVGVILSDPTLVSTLEGVFDTDWNSEYTRWVKEPENPLLLYLGVSLAGLAIVLVIVWVMRRGKSSGKRRKWIAELWSSSRHEV